MLHSQAGHNGAVFGRFAPSPTGELHVGNLRTALVAWLAARGSGREFLVRMEDLDRVQAAPEHERSQLADLAALGLDWDGEVVRQSERFDRYRAAIDQLAEQGLVYPCYCSRREIREQIAAAVQAPHGPPGAYPGTCRDLDKAARQTKGAEGRSPALRLRADGVDRQFADLFAGDYSGPVDDVVLARADGVPAYNLAVVVDDAAQQVDQVIRGDDLLDSTPRQIMLQQLLNLPTPDYGHVPLVVDAEGRRLAKRDEPVTARQLTADGWTMEQLVSVLGQSLGLVAPGESVTSEQLLQRFAPELVPREPMVWTEWLRRGPTG